MTKQESLTVQTTPTTRIQAKHIGLFVLMSVVGLFALYASQGMLAHPFRGWMDATIYAELGFRLNNPHLYIHDPVVPYQPYRAFGTFHALLPDAWETLRNVETTYLTLTLGLGTLFGIGAYLLVYEIFQQRDLALLTALISMLVERQLMQTPGGWGIRIITPRYVVFGLSPLLLWLYWRWRKGWKVAIAFAAFGLLLFMHPRFPVALVIIMSIGLMLQEKPSVKHLKYTAVRIAPFILFFLIILWLALSGLGTAAVNVGRGASVELGEYDFPGGVIRQLFFSSVDLIVPLVLGVLGWRSKREKEGIRPVEQEALLTFSLIPIALYAAFWLLIQGLPVFKRLNPKRFLTWVYLVPYAFGTYWILDRWRQGSLRLRLMAAVATVALLVATFGQVRALLLEDNPTYRQVVNWVYDRLGSADTEEQHAVLLADAAQADDIENDWGSFHDLCDWARTETNVEAVFVVPPRNFSLFRLYSQRSLYTMARNIEGIARQSGSDLIWKKYEAATAAYKTGTLEAFQALSTLGRADYVVVERGEFTLSAPLVYENRRYLVYELSTAP